MPPHDVYVEPFAGSGVVARNKRPASRTILVDRNADTVASLRARVDDAWDVRVGDGIEFLERHAFSGSELVYCDPPYVRSSRRSDRRIYRHELSDADHERLLLALRGLPCHVVVSAYPTPLYAKWLTGWHCSEFPVTTRGGPAIECVWTNFSHPSALHDDRYIGESFRKRQDARRRLTSLRGRLARLSPPERAVIHHWLAEQIARDAL
jgi:DNA adenine methylase